MSRLWNFNCLKYLIFYYYNYLRPKTFEILGVEALRILDWLTCLNQQRILIYAMLELQLLGLDLLEDIRSQILGVELEANHDLANVLWLGHFQFFIGYAVLIVALLQRSA